MKARLFIFCIALVLYACVWESPDGSPDYLPLDDSEYPYAGLPRMVVETEDFKQINNKVNKIPAKLQIYGENGPTTAVLDLTVKGRGNSSFMMPKYGVKLEFNEKQSFGGFPKNRDWNLVPNFRDKSHLRNYLTYQLAGILGDDYFPKCSFVEFYLNRTYMGLYLLVESVKVGKNRVNIAQDNSSFLIEKTRLENLEDIHIYSSNNYVFRVRYPKDPSSQVLEYIKDEVDSLEVVLKDSTANLDKYIDVKDFVRYYWIQEFSKNSDGAFGRSIFITKEKDDVFRMGPVWDFDIAYGISNHAKSSPSDWLARTQGWFKFLLANKNFHKEVNQYWKENKNYFLDLRDSAYSAQQIIRRAVKNDEKKWPILDNDESWPFVDSYSSYEESVDYLTDWISQRFDWISNHL